MNGILVVNKPAGLTSHQVVGRVRRLSGIRKIGHTGTLDPDVTGVLPLCIGSATRLAEFMLEQRKSYRGEITFGFSTTTQDASGDVLEEVDQVMLTEAEIHNCFREFVGEIVQQPSAYSAIRINGQRAYELARKGQEVTMPTRKVTIYDLTILSMDLHNRRPRVTFDVTSSKGTYVRTLCHDIGLRLGFPAHMSGLIRMQSGPFSIEDSHTLEEIGQACEKGEFQNLLLPGSTAIGFLPRVIIHDTQKRRVDNGMPMTFYQEEHPLEVQIGDRLRIEDQEGSLLAIYRVEELGDGNISTRPYKVFKE